MEWSDRPCRAAGPASGAPPSPALVTAGAAIAALARGIRRQRLASLKAGARIMLAEPWRLGRLFGVGAAAAEAPDRADAPAPAALPEGAARDALLRRAGGEIGYWEGRRRAGLPVDGGRLMGLRQARLALRWARRRGAAAPAGGEPVAAGQPAYHLKR